MKSKSLSFLHHLIDGGLLYLNHYLEEQCECSFFQITPSNRIVYDGNDLEKVRQLAESILVISSTRDYLYLKDCRSLVYCFRVNEFRNLFVFYNVEESSVLDILDVITDIYVPVSHFLKGLYFTLTQYTNLTSYDPDRIFRKDSEYWQNILAERRITRQDMCQVLLFDPCSDLADIKEVYRFTSNLTLQEVGPYTMIFAYCGRIAVVISEDTIRSRRTDSYEDWRSTLSRRFNCEFVYTAGSLQSYYDMKRSYDEALLALFYRSYFSMKEKEIRFTDIKVMICDPQISSEDFFLLEKRFSVLNSYENDRCGYLLTTLRALVRSRFNYEETAQYLHIHANTLYYRQNKLADLLNADFTSFEDRMSLFQNLFAYDYLKFANHSR